jgi:hypothetical protein
MNRSLERLTAMFECAEISRRRFVKLAAIAGLASMSQVSVLAANKERTTSSSVANQVNQRLGKATPVKRWLARLLLRKFRLLEQVDELTRMGPFERGFGCKLGTMPLIQSS